MELDKLVITSTVTVYLDNIITLLASLDDRLDAMFPDGDAVVRVQPVPAPHRPVHAAHPAPHPLLVTAPDITQEQTCKRCLTVNRDN